MFIKMRHETGMIVIPEIICNVECQYTPFPLDNSY
jgi:hypothetical protein